MKSAKTVTYELETIASPIQIAETFKYLNNSLAQIVSVNELAASACDSETQRDAMLIAKYSDKKMKGKTKTLAKMEKKIDKSRRPRFYLPLIFTTPEKKSIVRRLKVVDVKDDKRFHLGSDSEQWVKAYGEMILCTVEKGLSGTIFVRNPYFSLETFRKCGGVLNARFWDLNMRYAAAVIPLIGEIECYNLLHTAVMREMTGDNWLATDRSFYRSIIIGEQKEGAAAASSED